MYSRLGHRMLLLFSFAAMITFISSVAAQDNYPRQPITLVLPYPAGSGTDQVARLMAQGMSAELKVPVVIDNKPGGNGFIASSLVARAVPDGYTLLVSGGTTHAINPHTFKQLPYDPVKDFTPVTLAYKGFLVLMVNSSSPAKSVGDLVNIAKASPGKLNFGWGAGPGRIAAELLNQTAGLQVTNVPYRGNPQAVAALLGSEIDFIFTDGPTAKAQVATGKLRALAVTSPQRLPGLSEVPTMEEQGFKGYEVSIWNGLYLPPGAPPAITARLNNVVSKVLSSPELQSFGTNNVTEVVASTPEGLAQFQASESATASRVLRAAGIRPE